MSNFLVRAWDGEEMYQISDLYWFEENGVHDFGGDGHFGKHEIMLGFKIDDKAFYEDDIVEWEDGIGVVSFSRGCFRHSYWEKFWDEEKQEWIVEDWDTQRPTKQMWHEVEVVGNVHENPDLIKKQ